MAVSATHLTTSGNSTDGNSFTTASITPTAGRLILAAVENRANTAVDPNTPTLTGNGLTWVQVATVFVTNTQRITVFRAMGGSPSAGAITIDLAGQDQFYCEWSISEFAGVDTGGTNGSGAIGQTASNTDTGTNAGITVTLGFDAASTSATFGAVRTIGDGTAKIVSGSGFSELGESGDTDSDFQSQFKATSDTSVDWTWPSVASNGVAVAVEIKVPSASVGGFKSLLGVGS